MTTPTNPLGKDLLASMPPEERATLLRQAEAELAAPAAPEFSIRDQIERDAPAAAPHRGGVTIEEADALRAAAEAAESEDFERFWDSRKVKAPKALRNVLGIDLVLPPSLPLSFEIESRRLQDSSDPRDVARMFDLLFGEGRYDELVARGMDADRFGVILMWGTLNSNGIDITLAEANAKAEEMKARQGKALAMRALESGAT
jgi:hypothetical protein